MDKVFHDDSRVIAWLRFPLAAMVVYLHSLNVEFTPIDILNDIRSASYDILFYDTIRILISRVLGHVVVPTFMFISGYLFFVKLDKWKWDIYLRKIRSRIHTLIIPYFLWIIIPVFINIVWLHKPLLISNYLFSIWEIGLWHILTDPLNSVLWFLRDLIVLVFLSPVIYILLNKIKYILFIALFVLGLIFENTLIHTGFWFSLGGLFSMFSLSISNFSKRVKNIALWGFMFFGLLKLILYNDNVSDCILMFLNNFISQSCILFGVFLCFYFSTTKKCKNVQFPIWISSGSFLVYVLHMEVLWRVRWLMNLFAGNIYTSPAWIFFVYIIAPIVTLCILVILNFLLRKFFPKINYILTASR